ncbi:MAG: hypothetical protein DHS20C15_15360 [Planctomycetota bacterium]|nr:MAG: hypothetical protein DHS20C15_15360 [Planctomycetota bacterium]
MTRSFLLLIATPLLAAVLADSSAAQARMLAPMASPRAVTTQTVGITEVTVDYSRPGLNGRHVLKDPNVVPFDNPALPWRAGANENTVISFDRNVTVGGKPLAAGSYGLHIYPKTNAAWTVMFSHNTGAWGSYTYNANEDAARIDVMPDEGPKTERLSFDFEDLDNDGATLVLAWDTLRLPIKIGVDTTAHMVDYLNNDYTRGYGFWIAAQQNQAAAWCDANDVNLENALAWATRGANGAPNYNSLSVKASLEEKLGRADAAAATRAAAEPYATEAQRNAFGYQLMSAGKLTDAIAVFTENLEKFPNSWNAHDSLAEAYANVGKRELAIELYTKALELAPDDTNRQRITHVLQGLRG